MTMYPDKLCMGFIMLQLHNSLLGRWQPPIKTSLELTHKIYKPKKGGTAYSVLIGVFYA